MVARRRESTELEGAIKEKIGELQRRAENAWRGREKLGAIELIRAIDTAAVSRLHSRQLRTETYNATDEDYMRIGVAVALRPLLQAVTGQPGGVPWGPSSKDAVRFSRSYLLNCGMLTHLLRMAALEHYGLASTRMTGAGRWIIETGWGLPELAAREALREWRARSTDSAGVEVLKQKKRLLRPRMQSYVQYDPTFLIRYDNDLDIVTTYRDEARIYGRRFLEGEAFPPDTCLGGRPFAEWRNACDQALGRVLCHIDFAVLLYNKFPKELALSNLFTIFARRGDVANVWECSGLASNQIDTTMNALTLSIEGLDDWEQAYEPPTPYYVPLGQDFLLLPCFGALTNPYFALFRHLRTTYKEDWDRGVEQRENIFRADILHRFPSPRYIVPQNGFVLRRADGSTLTDIDAIIFDRERGTLALVQLKWHDVMGRSLSERESRRRNIGEANKWIERVLSWVDGRSSAEVLRALGIQGLGSGRPPYLYVVARYLARFSGEHDQDPRAAWLSWPEILRAADDEAVDPLSTLPESISAHQARFKDLNDVHEEFKFGDLNIELDISGARSALSRSLLFRVSKMSQRQPPFNGGTARGILNFCTAPIQ